jgi:uncharacterized Zn finger protein (UPF0148 family)
MNAETTSATHCPKCHHRFPARPGGSESCPRCGLTFALWTPVADAPAAELDDQAERLWSTALADWDTLENHEAFVKYCSRAGVLALAGRRYRERLDHQPSDAVAAQMQARILTMATAGYIPPSPVPAPVTRSLWFWVVVALCGVAGMTIAFFLRR